LENVGYEYHSPWVVQFSQGQFLVWLLLWGQESIKKYHNNFDLPLSNLTFRCIKGTVAWDFLSKVIPPIVPNWSLNSWSKAVLNINLNSPSFQLLKSFLAIGHRGKFDHALWATAANWWCAMGHCSEFGDALWATAANSVMRYGPLQRIWWCAMGHCSEFGDVLWATAEHLAMPYGLLRPIGYALWATAWNEAMQ
jgi:hypothetical protein